MNNIAIYSAGTVIYWNSIIICLAVAAWFTLSMALYRADKGRRSAMWLVLAVGTVLSVLLSRLIHWYCHPEQYGSLINALKDYSGGGGYCLLGVMLGVLLAGLAAAKLRFADSAAQLFDALVPGAALGIALIRLSALFDSSCRSTISIKNPALQRLPIASLINTSAEATDYRFATFFVQFILMMILTVILVAMFCRRRKAPVKRGLEQGHIAMLGLVFYSVMELVLDSTRYDSSFLRINGFVSIVQIVSALTVLAVMIYYSRQSVKANGLRFWHFLLWFMFAAGVGLAGAFEYLVQRHGGWYRLCYSVMSAGAVIMALMVYIMYRTLCVKEKRA